MNIQDEGGKMSDEKNRTVHDSRFKKDLIWSVSCLLKCHQMAGTEMFEPEFEKAKLAFLKTNPNHLT